MNGFARYATVVAATIGLTLSPVAAQANTRAQDSATYAIAAPGAALDGDTSTERKKSRKRGGWISHDDLGSIMLLIGGFGVAFAIILAGGSGYDGTAPNQSNGAN